jgi:ABC-2 type transport system permease protein
VPIRGSLPLIYAFVAALHRRQSRPRPVHLDARDPQAQAIQASFLFLLPNVLLSGFMFPREAMPQSAARWIGLALPLTYFLQVMRGIILKGVGLAELWPQALALVVFSALFFTFSALRFHKQLE